VPQQINQSDCGLFLLKFVEHALFSAPKSMTKDAIYLISTDINGPMPKDRRPVDGECGTFLGESLGS
jgi:hypothetical protein